jgi:hypothetical protein
MTRIRLDVGDLRRGQTVLTHNAQELAEVAQALRAAPLPELPPGIEGHVMGGLRRGSHRCDLLADHLQREAQGLKRRADRVAVDLARTSPNYCLPQPRLEAAKPKGKSWFRKALDFVLLDDIETLRDPKAPGWEKGLAAVSLLPFGVTKLAKGGKVAKAVAKGGKGADDVKPSRLPSVEKVGPRYPIGSRHAGNNVPLPPAVAAKYPAGVRFNAKGFPDFSPYRRAEASFPITGKHKIDERIANRKAGLKKTPEGYTWHHVEDTRTMLLVPTDLHDAVKHTGGVAVDRHRRLQQAARRVEDVQSLRDPGGSGGGGPPKDGSTATGRRRP